MFALMDPEEGIGFRSRQGTADSGLLRVLRLGLHDSRDCLGRYYLGLEFT